jgi:O-antigen/teichoic acid export membrane protein
VAQALLLAFATSRLAPVLVALLAGDAAAGYFGAAFRVYDVLSIVPVTLIGAVYPELARTPAAHPRFRALSTQAVEALLLVAWPIALGLAVGAPWLIRVLYGPGFLSAGPILTLVGIAVACSMVQHFCGSVFLALDHPGRLRAVALLAFATSVLVTPVLVLKAGAVGAAVAVLVVEAVSLVASLVSLHRLGAGPLGRGAGKGLAATAVGAAVATLWPAGDGGRLLVALGGYAVALLVLRPVPGPVWARLWRGALGRTGPPSGGGER